MGTTDQGLSNLSTPADKVFNLSAWLKGSIAPAHRQEVLQRSLAQNDNRYLLLTQVFSALGHDLSAAVTPQEAARIIVSAAQELLGWDVCYLHLSSAGHSIIPVLTMDTIGAKAVEIPPDNFSLDPSPLMLHVLEKGATLIQRDLGQNVVSALAPLVLFGDKGRPSACSLYVPVRHAGHAIGILSIQSYTPQAYCREDLRTLQTLSDHCSAALDRIKTASTLQENEIKNRALLDAIVDWVFRFRKDGTVLASKAPKDFVLPVREVHAEWKQLKDLLTEPVLQKFHSYIEQALRSGEPQLFEFQQNMEMGIRHYETRLVISNAEELLAIVRDVTERKRLEQEVLEISAAERRRIGHDLHDGLGQYVGGIAFKAKLLEQDLLEKSLAEGHQAKEIVHLLNNLMRQVQSIARGLDPVEAEASGLVPALAKLARDTESVFRVKCLFITNCSNMVLDGTRGLHLYRIAQEAIHNAIKHAAAQLIQIELAGDPALLRLVISNDGSGFGGGSDVPVGMGLRTMHYRARLLGGALQISSSGERTSVCCKVPLSAGVVEPLPPPPENS